MDDVAAAIREGHFAKKQIFCRDPLISWSHASRFDMGLEVVRSLEPETVLDHGCGDGTFLAYLMTADPHPRQAVGTEITSALVSSCQARFADVEGLDFVASDRIDDPAHHAAYDVVVCMEVLEHVVELEREIDRLFRLVRPGGRLVVSVPVEIGLPLVLKLIYRRIAGWRGIGDYPGDIPYRAGELIRSLFAGRSQQIPRPVFNDGAFSYHGHKGFNWKRLRSLLEERFSVERQFGSPIRWLPGQFNSQVWLVGRKPTTTG